MAHSHLHEDPRPTDEGTYDVVVIGGGAAGLSGALALARARRSVLVVDSGAPRNAPASGVHNYLGKEGTPPGDLLAAGRAEIAGYGGEVVTDQVVAAVRADGAFTVTLAGGTAVRARRLLIATGVHDRLPEVPGLAERWGRDVLHCPYCHGWEVRDKRIGVLGSGPLGVHRALLWRQWSQDTLLLVGDGGPLPSDGEAHQLAGRGVTVVAEPVLSLAIVEDRLIGVRLADDELLPLDAVVVASRPEPRLEGLDGLGLDGLGLRPVPVELAGQVIGEKLATGVGGATDIQGVWAAGNVADPMATVLAAASGGLTAGTAINADLVGEDTELALANHRHQQRTMFERDAWEARYAERPAIWSGLPNPQLVAEVSALPPGRALDIGCGEGGDAIWLADRGWQVTAVDIAATALERAAANAATAGEQLAARITWTQVDLRTQPPAAGTYDLVSAHYMHLPAEQRRSMYAGLADAVAPGGTLLLVGHHPSDLRLPGRRMHFPDMMFTAEQVAADLDPAKWQVLATDRRRRTATDHDGQEMVIHDAVLVARRTAA